MLDRGLVLFRRAFGDALIPMRDMKKAFGCSNGTRVVLGTGESVSLRVAGIWTLSQGFFFTGKAYVEKPTSA